MKKLLFIVFILATLVSCTKPLPKPTTTVKKGTKYYRIKQVDKNGKYDYSKTIQVKFKD